MFTVGLIEFAPGAAPFAPSAAPFPAGSPSPHPASPGPARRDQADPERAILVDAFYAFTVRAGLDLARVHLFGNSWGGWLAMAYLLEGAEAPRSLTISSAPASVAGWLQDAARLRAALPAEVRAVLDHHEQHGWLACPEYTAACAYYYQRHVCRVRPWPECVERSFAGLNGAIYQAMWGASEFGPVTGVLRDFDVRGQLSRITVPTLVTAGRHDEAAPDRMAELAAEIHGARLRIYEDSSHMAFVEEPDAYVRDLGAFLREHD
jgi:proline-specific peptidase